MNDPPRDRWPKYTLNDEIRDAVGELFDLLRYLDRSIEKVLEEN
jgi:hypothetical protein